ARVPGRPGVEELVARAVREARELIASCRRAADAGRADVAEKMDQVAPLPGALLDLGEKLAVWEGTRARLPVVPSPRRVRGEGRASLRVVRDEDRIRALGAVAVMAVLVTAGGLVPHHGIARAAGAVPVVATAAVPSRPLLPRVLERSRASARTGRRIVPGLD